MRILDHPILGKIERRTKVKIFFSDKNLLWDELNVLKWKSNVKTKQGIDDYRLKTSMAC